MLLRTRVTHQLSAVRRQRRAQIRALPPAKPGVIIRNGRIATPDHLEFEISGKVLQRHGRMLAEVSRTETASLFATKQSEKDRAALRRSGQHARQFQTRCHAM